MELALRIQPEEAQLLLSVQPGEEAIDLDTVCEL